MLQANNGLRDAAQHHTLSVSEQHLYIQCQAGLSLFRKLLSDVFDKHLHTSLPTRVLPLSTSVPTDLTTLFDTEVDEIKKLLRPATRHRIEAVDKLRALVIVEAALNGQHVQPSQSELLALSESLKSGSHWQSLFPGVALINITATGEGPSIDLRITKKDGTPVALVKEGTPGASVVAIKRVNELDFYSLGARKLAEKVGLTVTQLLATVEHLDLQSDSECFKKIQIDSQELKRYSPNAIPKIQACVETEDLAGMIANIRANERRSGVAQRLRKRRPSDKGIPLPGFFERWSPYSFPVFNVLPGFISMMEAGFFLGAVPSMASSPGISSMNFINAACRCVPVFSSTLLR